MQRVMIQIAECYNRDQADDDFAKDLAGAPRPGLVEPTFLWHRLQAKTRRAKDSIGEALPRVLDQ